MILLTTDEVADRLRLQVTTIRGLIRDRRLIAVKIGNEYRITEEDLAEFIRRNRTKRGRNERDRVSVVPVE